MAPPARPTTAEWNMEEMTDWLAGLQEQSVEKFGEEKSAYVYPTVLIYKDLKAKANYTAGSGG